MSRLQFQHGFTIHSWSGYGDGHINLEQLLPELKFSAVYESTRKRIMDAEILIIDEVGLLSAKIITSIEHICRYVRNSEKLFGGIQVIAGGSFVQLPPVPSVYDEGKFAFESPVFRNVFPHRITLHAVLRQNELDLINAINELCEGTPSATTHALMRSLKRPVVSQDKKVYIFGTNYEVDFFNIMTVLNIQSNERIFTAHDTGDKTKLVKCGAPKYLVLKLGCQVIISRNLQSGLVNGLSAVVTELREKSVKIVVDTDKHLNHAMQGMEFTVSEYIFQVRDINNQLTASRTQLPLKLGYAITVDKAQGRTLDAVIIDSGNFWRPGQIGVAVGRASSKDGLEFITYNSKCGELKHPQLVRQFYSERSLLMTQNLKCCRNHVLAGNNPNTYQLQVAGAADIQLQPLGQSQMDYMRNVPITQFPYDIGNYMSEFIDKMPKITGIHMEQRSLLIEVASSQEMITFLNNAFSTLIDLFNKCKLSDKKRKCNWCRMCAHLHNVFGSEMYTQEIISLFKKRTSNTNAICTRIYFNILELIASDEAQKVMKDRMDSLLLENTESAMDDLDKSSLRYIAGACIHAVRHHFARMAMSKVFSDKYQSKLLHRKHQMTNLLIGPRAKIETESIEPESLLKLIQKDTGGLLYVTDQVFKFFILLLQKVKLYQNFISLQFDPTTTYIDAVRNLSNDYALIEMWSSLYHSESPDDKCMCPELESDISTLDMMMDYELDQVLLMDILERVIIYFCRVHLNEQVDQLKDYVLEKPKTFQLRHTLDESSKAPSQKKTVEYPCGNCNKECIDVSTTRKPSFEDFSVQCDKCDKWYHYICQNLSGKEPELKPNSQLPFFCTKCKESTSVTENSLNDETSPEQLPNSNLGVRGRGRGRAKGRARGRGRGIGRGRGRGTGNNSNCEATSSNNTEQTQSTNDIQLRSRSGRLLKSNKKYDS